MKVLYIETKTGIAGDMFVGSLLDLGLDFGLLEKELQKLPLDDFSISIEKMVKNNITGTKFKVRAKEVNHRHLKEIDNIIDQSDLDQDIKDQAKQIFLTIARAESKVHDKPLDKIHFHEVGSTDAIVDVVSSVIGLKMLKIDRVYCSKIPTGLGFVHCMHGKMPVPAPATVEILRGIPVYSGEIEGELTTPTGAAIVKNIVNDFCEIPEMQISKIGYGAGSKNFSQPNFVRVFMGELEQDYADDKIIRIETNIDDCSSEILGYTAEKLLNNRALDVYYIPIYMKKNRPAYQLTILVEEKFSEKILDIVFKETTTLGVRIDQVNRKKVLSRSIDLFQSSLGEIKIKTSKLGDTIVNSMPEYEDCKKIAQDKNIPLKLVYRKVLYEFDSKNSV